MSRTLSPTECRRLGNNDKDFICAGARGCRSYLHVADSSLLEGTVLQVVGADVAIFAPVTGEHTADTCGASERERERGRGGERETFPA